MFKIPDWGDDVPKTKIDLKKLLPGKNNSKKSNKTQAKVKTSNNLKAKNKEKSIVNGKITKLKNKNVRNSNKKQIKKGKSSLKVNTLQNKKDKQPTLNYIDVKDCDTDKLDEVILDAKKKKLIDSYKKEDNEETLFSESSESNLVKTKVSQNSKINGHIKYSPTKKQTDVKTQNKQLLMQTKKDTSAKIDLIKTRKNTKDTETIKGNKRKKTDTSHLNTDINPSKKVNTEGREIENRRKFIPAMNKLNNNTNHKKEILKNMLHKHRNPINVSHTSSKLRDRMLEKLNAAKFRFLNEKLYTSSGSEAQKLFKEDPAAFHTYHQGYQQQVKKWPVNPLDVVVRKIKSMPKTHLIADMGCGEAALSKRVPHSVRSFDLVATAPGVEVCDMAHTPLLSDSVEVVVFCLALMGTDLTQYLVEANRVLKTGGHLLIAEVESRFDDVDSFAKEVQKLGFSLRKVDRSHQVFYFMEFTKAREAPKKSKLPALYLKPCIYKKR